MRFRILLLVLGLLAAVKAQAVLVTATISITNTPATSNAWTVNGDARYWTNAQTATTILTNSTGIAPSLTNLLSQIDLKPYLNVQHAWLTTTQLTLKGSAVAVSFSGGGWATVSYVTNQGPIAYALLVPPTNVNASPIGVRTNNANYIADYLNLYGTTPLSTNAAFGSNYLSRGPQAQVVAGPTVFQTGIGGTNTGLTNGPIVGSGLSNVLYFVGNMTRMSNGYGTNQVFDGPMFTNGMNHGSAFSSPNDSFSGAEQFGTGALATNASATAVGKNALAGGTSSSAFGNVALATASASSAFGNNSRALAPSSAAFGAGAQITAAGTNSTALGTLALVQHWNSTAIGYNAQTTDSNQTMIADSTSRVVIPGQLLISGSQSNTTFTGTNQWTGDIALPWYDLTTLAAGNNLAVPIGTNTQVMLSGNGAAATIVGFTGGRDGRPIRLYNKSAYAITLAQNTSDPTPANRIVANVAGDWAFQPGEFWQIVWIPADSRWHLEIATAAGTNYITSGQNQTNLNVWPAGTAGPAITINGLASQTHPVLTVVSNGVTNLTVHANGNLVAQNLTNVNQIASGWQQVAGNTTNQGLQSQWIAASNITATASNATSVPLIAKQAGASTTNLAEFKDWGGAIRFGIDSNGIPFMSISNSALQYPLTGRLFQQTQEYTGNTNSSTATNSFFGTGVGSLALPANFWTVGRAVELKFRGLVWTPVTPGSSLFMINANVGTTPNTLCTNLYSVSGSMVGEMFEGTFTITCRTNSSIGFLQTEGRIETTASASDVQRYKVLKSTGLIFDTTQAMTLDGASTNGSTSIGYVIKGGWGLVIP